MWREAVSPNDITGTNKQPAELEANKQKKKA